MTEPDTTTGRTKLLLIDDDRKFCLLIADYLRPLGFDITAVHDGPGGVDQAVYSGTRWDAILLDVMLPDLDGFAVLKSIRQQRDTPVLMLTARGDEMDRIVGLEVGADDYVPKTFSTRELLARLRAILRRAARPTMDTPSPERVIGPLRINSDSRSAVLGDIVLTLTPVEFDLLASLAAARGRVKTREALLDEVRGRHFDIFDRSIDVHISSLRRKLGEDAKTPRFIRTLRSAGYMLVDPDAP